MRIKWSRLLVALLILLLFVYGGAVLLGLVRPGEVPGVGAIPGLDGLTNRGSPEAGPGPATPATAAAGQPERFGPHPGADGRAGAARADGRAGESHPGPGQPHGHARPAGRDADPQADQPGQDAGFRSEVAVPESQRRLPPGLRHRGLRQGVPALRPGRPPLPGEAGREAGPGGALRALRHRGQEPDQRAAPGRPAAERRLRHPADHDELLLALGRAGHRGGHRHRRRVRRGGQGHRPGQRGADLQRHARQGRRLLGQQRQRVPALLHAPRRRRPGRGGDPLRAGEPQPGGAALPEPRGPRGDRLVERRPDPGRAARRQQGADGPPTSSG